MTNPPFEIELFDGAPADAADLCAIVMECGLDGGQPADPLRFLAFPTARTWMARRQGRIAGFAATFESHTLYGPRLEVDLLGVLPAAQGQGVGTALIRRALEGWAGTARALIRVDNVPSERAFAGAGFVPEPAVRELLVLAPPRPSGDSSGEAGRGEAARAAASETIRLAKADGEAAGSFELLPVTTLTYRGAWVEACEVAHDSLRVWRAVAAGAGRWAAERGLDMVGALPALTQGRCRLALAEAGYVSEGSYRFFLLTPARDEP